MLMYKLQRRLSHIENTKLDFHLGPCPSYVYYTDTLLRKMPCVTNCPKKSMARVAVKYLVSVHVGEPSDALILCKTPFFGSKSFLLNASNTIPKATY